MPNSKFKFRHATSRDLRENFNLFEPDRPLYHPALWKKLPRLFEMLLETKRVRFALLEETSSGLAQMFAGHTFVNRKLFSAALQPDRYTVSDDLFSMVDAGRMPFLAPKQIATENADGSLIGFNFSATPEMPLGPVAGNDEDMLLCPADGATNSTTTVSAGTNPGALAVNPVTNKIYVGNNGSINVTVIDGATNSVATVATAGGISLVAVNQVTNKIYAASSNSDLTVIDR